MQCFEGLVDIYLADLKYFSPEKSLRYSDAYDYFLVASAALRKMFEQVGPCVFSHEGMLQRGLLIRHLVLPNGKADSEQILRWIAQEFNAKDIRISLMRQYTPCGDLSTCPEINRKLFSLEYTSILKIASEFGLEGYMQGRDCDNFSMTPAFDLTGVRKDAL